MLSLKHIILYFSLKGRKLQEKEVIFNKHVIKYMRINLFN